MLVKNDIELNFTTLFPTVGLEMGFKSRQKPKTNFGPRDFQKKPIILAHILHYFDMIMVNNEPLRSKT